jgi:hypothetical protein
MTRLPLGVTCRTMATFRSRSEDRSSTWKPTRRRGLMVGSAPSDRESDGKASDPCVRGFLSTPCAGVGADQPHCLSVMSRKRRGDYLERAPLAAPVAGLEP